MRLDHSGAVHGYYCGPPDRHSPDFVYGRLHSAALSSTALFDLFGGRFADEDVGSGSGEPTRSLAAPFGA